MIFNIENFLMIIIVPNDDDNDNDHNDVPHMI